MHSASLFRDELRKHSGAEEAAAKKGVGGIYHVIIIVNGSRLVYEDIGCGGVRK